MPISHSYLDRHASPTKRNNNHERAANPHKTTSLAALADSHAAMTEHAAIIGLRSGESRSELIERVKKEQRPAWLQDLASDTSHIGVPSLDPPVTQRVTDEVLADPLLIERPRSALHAGDFNQTASGSAGPVLGSPRPYSSRPGDSWPGKCPEILWPSSVNEPDLRLQSSPSRPSLHRHAETIPVSTEYRSRAASYSSSSSSFIYKAPTSPLAHHSSSNDLDSLGGFALGKRGRSPEKPSRRRTYSPQSLRHPSITSLSAYERPQPTTQRELAFAYQAHQPRQSMTFLNDLPLSIPAQSEAARRRSSVYSQSSPISRAPLVGRYEESILRGRMSTLPSKPLEFVAKIGVLGKGNCKANLKCPAHITVPFPAVFYDYGTPKGRSSASEEGPSPYVGLIDLTNTGKAKSNSKELDTSATLSSEPRLDGLSRRNKSARMTTSKVLVSAYRIPQQGQLQIVIKNPNKTAVKLFLVPYDLTGMTAGQKTFIRQRSYSAGPIIDMPLNCRTNLGTDRPEASLFTCDNIKDRPILRYLIHIHVCCPSEGRYYLYKNVRVVFANRVPDGKEKLRNEIQLPEPRYTPYKPEVAEQEPLRTQLVKSHSDMSSTVFGGDISPGLDLALNSSYSPSSPMPWRFRERATLLPPFESDMATTRPHSQQSDDMLLDEPSPKSTATRDVDMPISHVYDKLSHQDYGSPARAQSPQPGEGLIALQFRDWADQRRGRSPAAARARHAAAGDDD